MLSILSFLTTTDNLKMYQEGKENAITLKKLIFK
jgi:hypothetical protein